MSSNLKVNTILPSTGSNIGIGTNGGELNVDGGCKVQVGTALTLGHSTGVQFSTQNLHSTGFEVNQINASGIVTASHFYGNGANLTALNIVTDTSPQLGADLSSNGHHIVITDGEEIRLGDDHDTKIRFNGSKSQIVSSVQFDIDADIIDIHNASASAMKARFLNNQVELYYANSKKFETTTNGVKISSLLEIKPSTYTNIEDNSAYGLNIKHVNEKPINIATGGDYIQIYDLTSSKLYVRCEHDAGVKLYNNNTARIETTSTGAKVTGNLEFASAGQGIDFSATSDASGKTSELLDDYEEGTWNPIWSNATSGGTTTSNNMYGKYTKIGRMVHAYFYTWGLPAGNSGNMYLQGFPFTCNANPGAFFCAVQSAFYNFGADNYYNLGCRIHTNQTHAELIFCRHSSGNYVPATFAGFINYYTNFNGVLTYEVA